MKKFKSIVNVFFMLAITITGSFAADYQNIVTFGDSLTDSGNLFLVTSDTPNSYYYKDGRFSNGPIWAEYLSSRLGINGRFLLASSNQENISERTFFNNAFGGAETGSDASPPGFLTQINLWKQYGLFIPENSLCIVWIAANDILNWLSDNTEIDGAEEVVNTSVENIITGLTDLVENLYATDIMVINLPDLGRTPRFNYYGTELASNISNLFNNTLKTELELFSGNNPIIKLIQMDILSIMDKIFRNPSNYGIQNITDAAIYYESFQMEVFDNIGKFLFWDPIHPSTQTHKIISDQIYGMTFIEFEDEDVIFLETNTDKSIIGISSQQEDITFQSIISGSSEDNTSLDNKPDIFIYDILECSINVETNNFAELTIYLPYEAPSDSEWYNETDNGWVNFDKSLLDDSNGDGAVFSGDRKSITLHITDNGNYDDDETSGMVRLSSGLGTKYEIIDDNSGSGCFISVLQ